jgi:hypothetical protein
MIFYNLLMRSSLHNRHIFVILYHSKAFGSQLGKDTILIRWRYSVLEERELSPS